MQHFNYGFSIYTFPMCHKPPLMKAFKSSFNTQHYYKFLNAPEAYQLKYVNFSNRVMKSKCFQEDIAMIMGLLKTQH